MPHAALAPYVQCYWSIAPSARPFTNRVLPDGCLDILIAVDAAGCAAKVVGTMQRAEVHAMSGLETFIGVRFKPGGAFPFLRLPLDEVTNGELALANLWGKQDAYLAQQVYEAGSISERITRLEATLLRRYALLPPVDTLISNALHLLRTHKGGVSVQEMVARLALSERQLERRFRQQTGLSPKLFARVTRFRAAVMALQRAPLLPLDDQAQEMGFYDQAHFIHDFKAFSGVTPTNYMAEWSNGGFLQYPARLP